MAALSNISPSSHFSLLKYKKRLRDVVERIRRAISMRRNPKLRLLIFYHAPLPIVCRHAMRRPD